jgi:hypothetical protein
VHTEEEREEDLQPYRCQKAADSSVAWFRQWIPAWSLSGAALAATFVFPVERRFCNHMQERDDAADIDSDISSTGS